MESSRACSNCRKRTLVPDDVTGNTVCSSCGVVQDYDNFQAHIGGITGDAGTYVRVGAVGTGNTLTSREKKIYQAETLIEDFVFRLGLSVSKSQEVKLLIEKITNSEYGQGDWFPVFVGACAYVVMRKDQKTLPIVEVADVVGCDVHELGRMISRVVDFIDVKLPDFDIVNSFERSIKNCSSFGEVSEDVISKMLQQGVFLVQCLIKWFVTTGRRPMPVVAAVIVFVGELNQIHVKIEDVANELHVAVTTCRKRYDELLDNLVKVAKALPWGEDVTTKNILKNAPFVIRYMEMKSTKKRKSFEHVDFDMDGLVGDCLSKEIGYGFDSYSMEDSSSSQYFDLANSSNTSSDHPDKFQISPESLTMIYSDYLDEISLVKANAEIGTANIKKRRRNVDLEACTEWWSGQSDLSKKLLLKQILEKDVGLDVMPPSFDKGCLVKGKRQEKIKAAKLRIQRIMHPGNSNSGYSKDLYLFEPESPRKKKRKRKSKMKVDIDWEDLIIETLLLHNVKEEEIEKGHYNVLLALHVFDHGMV